MAVLGRVANALCWIRVSLATLIFHIPERLAGHWHSAPAGVNRRDSVLLWDRTFKGHVTICINSSAHVRSSRRDTNPRGLVDANSGSFGCRDGDVEHFLAFRRSMDFNHVGGPWCHLSNDRTWCLVH